jgi:AraC-like DNA-binding protein
MSRLAKDISIYAKMLSDAPIQVRAHVPGGVSFTDTTAGGAFRMLCAGHFARLRYWTHAHVFDPFWRIYYNSKKGAYIECGPRRIGLGPKKVVIVPANVVYEAFLETREVDHIFLHFLVDPLVMPMRDGPIEVPLRPVTRALLTDFIQGLEEGSSLQSQLQGLALLHHLFAPLIGVTTESGKRLEVLKVIREIEAHPHAFSNASQMAAFAGMSLRNFQRHFHETAGKTPAQYLSEARLREAARRLARTDLSVEEIAESLGFANRFHFSRLFRSFTGKPPAAFRKAHRLILAGRE